MVDALLERDEEDHAVTGLWYAISTAQLSVIPPSGGMRQPVSRFVIIRESQPFVVLSGDAEFGVLRILVNVRVCDVRLMDEQRWRALFSRDAP